MLRPYRGFTGPPQRKPQIPDLHMAPAGQSTGMWQLSVQYCAGGLPVGETSHFGVPLPVAEAGQVVPLHLGRQTQSPPPNESLASISPAGQPPLGLPAKTQQGEF